MNIKTLGNKKAAIELSVTAIVVLILAIVILGLGLGFIRGMFGRVATQFEQQIAAEPEPPTTSRADPLTLSRETIISNAGNTEVLKVGIYNPTSENWNATKYNVSVTCSGITFTTQANIRTLKQGESDTFNVLFEIPKYTPEKTHLCYAWVGPNSSQPYYSKDLTLKVTK